MIKSRLTEEKKEEIFDKTNEYYLSMISAINEYSHENNAGGKIRQAMGNLGENLSKFIWIEISKLYKDISIPVEPKKGEDDQKECKNDKGNIYKAHVDKHCYIGDKFILAIESKSYLDSCYCLRASDDFRLLKKYFDPKLICIVVSIEDAAKESSRKFIEDEGWIDAIFILADGKRTSAKPIWKKDFFKKLNKEKVIRLFEYLDTTHCEYLNS